MLSFFSVPFLTAFMLDAGDAYSCRFVRPVVRSSHFLVHTISIMTIGWNLTKDHVKFYNQVRCAYYLHDLVSVLFIESWSLDFFTFRTYSVIFSILFLSNYWMENNKTQYETSSSRDLHITSMTQLFYRSQSYGP